MNGYLNQYPRHLFYSRTRFDTTCRLTSASRRSRTPLTDLRKDACGLSIRTSAKSLKRSANVADNVIQSTSNSACHDQVRAPPSRDRSVTSLNPHLIDRSIYLCQTIWTKLNVVNNESKNSTRLKAPQVNENPPSPLRWATVATAHSRVTRRQAVKRTWWSGPTARITWDLKK